MVALAYDGLTQLDPDGKLLPALADRWTVSRGAGGRTGLRYVFHLRAGVRFHDGTRVTPATVRQSFLRVLAPGPRGGRAPPPSPLAADAGGRVRGGTAQRHGSPVRRNGALAAAAPRPAARNARAAGGVRGAQQPARPAREPESAAGDQLRGERARSARHRVRWAWHPRPGGDPARPGGERYGAPGLPLRPRPSQAAPRRGRP